MTLTQNRALKDAVIHGDRQKLLEMERGLFANLHRNNAVTHLYFIDPQRICVLRVHQPDRFGDRIGRVTLAEAESTGDVSYGLEMGPLGTLTLLVVMPWVEDGKLIGFVELGKEIDDLLVSVRKQFGIFPLLFIPKSRLDRQGWEVGMQMLGRNAQWDEFPDAVLTVRDGLPMELIRRVHEGQVDHLRIDDRWYSWKLQPLIDAAGMNAGELGMVMDVTARHNDFHQFSRGIAVVAFFGSLLVIGVFWVVLRDVDLQLLLSRNALSEQEKRYHSLFENSSAVALLVDPVGGYVVEANAAAAEYYGWDHDRLSGVPLVDIAARPGAFGSGAFGNGAFGGGTGIPVSGLIVSRHRLSSGDERDVEVFVTPMSIGGKELSYCLVHDITERRRAEIGQRSLEASLLATTARLKLVMETTAEGILGIDDESRVILANAAAAAFLGLDSTDGARGKLFPEVTGHLNAEGMACKPGEDLIFRTLRDGCTRRVQDEFFTRQSGTQLPVEYVVSPLVVSDIVVGAVIAFHGICERKALEEDLRRSNSELEQFAYVASHDLRQPLRMISSYLSLLERKLGNDLDQDGRDFLSFAVEGAKHMDALIISLLEYARIGRDQASDPVPLDQAIGNALNNLKFTISDAGAQVTVAPGMPTIYGNFLEFMRLFQNLIGNAIAYRSPDRVPDIHIGWREEPRQWVFWVQDNGVGIGSEYLERVFQIFQRLVTQDQVKGTGIGLAVSRKIVETHHGQIWVESEMGKGSTFYVVLPKARTCAL